MTKPADARLRQAFQEALQGPSKLLAPHPSTLVSPQGPLEGRRPDRSQFLLSVQRIRPDSNQVRRSNKSATEVEVQELAATIREVGILEPLTVRYLAAEDLYEVIAGERRLTAGIAAGLQEVPVKIVDADAAQARRLQLIENVHRADLPALELALALAEMEAAGESVDAIARLLCKSPTFVSKALTVARGLDSAARQQPGAASASIDVLYEVALMPAAGQAELVERLETDHLTRSDVRRIAARARASNPKSRGRPASSRAYRETIRVDELGATVTIAFSKCAASSADVLQALRQAQAIAEARLAG